MVFGRLEYRGERCVNLTWIVRESKEHLCATSGAIKSRRFARAAAFGFTCASASTPPSISRTFSKFETRFSDRFRKTHAIVDGPSSSLRALCSALRCVCCMRFTCATNPRDAIAYASCEPPLFDSAWSPRRTHLVTCTQESGAEEPVHGQTPHRSAHLPAAPRGFVRHVVFDGCQSTHQGDHRFDAARERDALNIRGHRGERAKSHREPGNLARFCFGQRAARELLGKTLELRDLLVDEILA